MSKLNRINCSNWKDFFNSNLVYVMFSKKDCEQCEKLEAGICLIENSYSIRMCKVVLSDSGLAELKMEHSWISNIDILPFNTIFSNGKMLDSWSGSSIERFNLKLKKYLD